VWGVEDGLEDIFEDGGGDEFIADERYLLEGGDLCADADVFCRGQCGEGDDYGCQVVWQEDVFP